MKRLQIIKSREFLRITFVILSILGVVLFFYIFNLVFDDSQGADIDEIVIDSRYLNENLILKVYKPEGYSENVRYPVLYFIADYGGSAFTVMDEYLAGAEADALLKNGEITPMIIVGINIDKSFGINSASKKETFETSSGLQFNKGRYMDYVIEEIIPLIDRSYSTITSREGRYIGGYSMGGYAALHIAFNNPDMFSKVGGHSPSLFQYDFPDDTISAWLYPTTEIREERDPIYLAQKKEISNLSIFLDVEAGGSSGPKYLYDILAAKGMNAQFKLLGKTHGRSTCAENMKEYLKFYAGTGKTVAETSVAR